MKEILNRVLADYNDSKLQQRRVHLLQLLEQRINEAVYPEILYKLKQDQSAAFIIGDNAATVIRKGLRDKRRQENESTALAYLAVAAQTPDSAGIVYRIDKFAFENIGEADYVLASEREYLGAGEVEVHTHVYSRPAYLDQVDIGDVVTALAGPSWVDPNSPLSHTKHLRVFGILSLHQQGFARLQFYCHNLKRNLSAKNNYGLQKWGTPITLLDAF
jgi:hypothetical protein